MNAYNKVKTVIQVYLDNNSYLHYLEIVDANRNTVKECIIELFKVYKQSYEYYLHRDNFESALIAKRKLSRLNKLSNKMFAI